VTRDDLAVVSRLFACWSAGDLEGMLSCLDPRLEWRAAADGRLYKGHDGAREFFARWQDAGQQLEVPLQRAIEVAPGRILVVGRLRVLRPGRGLADSPGVWGHHVDNGLVTRIESFASEREATDSLRMARRAASAKPAAAHRR
jgi:ketosteroid isomerase-like protein